MFKGEMSSYGQDAGGMEKEWFNLVTEQFLNPEQGNINFTNSIGLFRLTRTDEISYTIKESSQQIGDFKKRFEFFGLMLAKAIFDEIPLNLCLNKLVYRLILDPNSTIYFEDIKDYDTAVYNSLKYMRDNDIDDDEYFEFYFQHEFDGEMFSLVPGGDTLRVTDQNKEEYLVLKSEIMVKIYIIPQIESIRRGFQKLVPLSGLQGFSDKDFQYLCCGEDEIDIEDWKNHTYYEGEYSEDSNVIEWFWNYLDS
jgi:hypothetical protein